MLSNITLRRLASFDVLVEKIINQSVWQVSCTCNVKKYKSNFIITDRRSE